MRDTIVGTVLALVLVAALFAMARLHPHSPGEELARAAGEVQQGFTGVKMFGSWQLACPPGPSGATSRAPVPFSLNPNPRTAAAVVAGETLGRCRTTLVFRRKDNPKAIVLIVGLRLAGEKLALIVRFPALAKKGDSLQMRLAQGALKLPVSDCGKDGCLAVGLLGQQALDHVLASPSAILVYPTLRNGKPLGMLVPFNGLKEAVAAMRRAES